VGVALNMRLFAGQIVDSTDPDSMLDVFADILQANPSQADDLAYKILNTQVLESNLTAVGKDFVLDQIIDNQLKSGTYDPTGGSGLTEEELEYLQSGTGATSTGTSSTTSFDWGAVINSSIPSILAAFGITPQQNSTAAQPTQQSSGTNWTIILIVLAVLAVIGFIIYRANK